MSEFPTQRNVVCDPSKDGIEHINVYTKARSKLGRELTNPSELPVQMPVIGEFRTVEALWWWLSTGCQHHGLKTLPGLVPKITSQKQSYKRFYVPKFEEIMKYAIAWKIKHNEDLSRRFFASRLPLVHYYTYGSVGNEVVRPANGSIWTIDFLEELRLMGEEGLEKYLKDNLDDVVAGIEATLSHFKKLHSGVAKSV
jgi:hypothetical protein